MKVRIISNESFNNRPLNSVGSSRIRGRWLAKYWDELEKYKIGEAADVMIFQKVYWKEMLESFNGLKILDLCDPDWLDGAPVIEAISHCDAVVTSSAALASALAKMTDKPVKHIPDRFDLQLFQEPKKEHKEKVRSAFWYGYSHKFEPVVAALPYLRKESIKLTAMSDRPIVDAYEWIEYDFSNIHSEMKKHDFAVLPEGEKRKFSSNNKEVEAWLCGVPVVKSYEDMQRLVTREARESKARACYNRAVKDYDVKLSVQEYKELLADLT